MSSADRSNLLISKRSLAGAVWLCVALTLSGLPARADLSNDIQSILARASSGGEAQVIASSRQLAEFGAQADALLFDELARECKGQPKQVSTRASALLGAFDLIGPARWRPLISAKLGVGADTTVIAPIYSIVGRSGTSKDLPFALYCAGFDHAARDRDLLERTVTNVLRRDIEAFAVIDSAMQTISQDLRSCMVRAVEATKHRQGAVLLARWLEGRREMRTECLQYLSRLSLALEKPIAPEVLSPVRTLVEGGDETCLNEAVLCAGRLGDYDAVAALIRHLKDGEYGLRAGALWSLRQITTLQFGEDPRAWAAWFEVESQWWSNDSRRVFTDLVHGSKSDKVAALRQVSILHAWRDRAAEEITIALDDIDVEIAELTVAQLERLNSSRSIPALIDALFGGRPTVAALAHSALESIAKRKLPEDPMACREALLPGR